MGKIEPSKLRKRSVVIVLIFCLSIMTGILSGCSSSKSSANESASATPEYVEKIFGANIISIDILADETEWQTMLDNATKEEYIKVDVVVNGTKFTDVGIRPKGNSSLKQVAASDSDRYSFRLKFDEYVEDQTCFGLESFVVNNMLGDNTYMKEYISYDLMKTIGVDCPYFGYTNITVNDEPWGLYLAVELYNDSYEERVYGDTSGMLYNVKMSMGNMGEFGGNPPNRPQDMPQAPNNQNIENNSTPKAAPGINNDEKLPNGGGGKMGASDTGGSLQYSDDSSSSYSAIFENAVGKSDESDYQRVITALKALSNGTDLEKYFDVDAILRYLAAHTIVVNLDSYSSRMAQNYYLYENEGKLTILPWDYNLAWGGFQNGDVSAVINFPIDTPVSGVEMSSRPLIDKLFANSEYLETYHLYLQELIDSYFADGKFEAKVQELNKLISDYVNNDPTAFCTYEEYEKAFKSFITLGNLRAESVQGQLEGTVPITTAEQTANPDQLIKAGTLNLSDLGSMMGGRGPNDGPDGNMPDRETMQKVMQILQDANGSITNEVKIKLKELGLNDNQISMLTNMQRPGQNGNTQNKL